MAQKFIRALKNVTTLKHTLSWFITRPTSCCKRKQRKCYNCSDVTALRQEISIDLYRMHDCARSASCSDFSLDGNSTAHCDLRQLHFKSFACARLHRHQ